MGFFDFAAAPTGQSSSSGGSGINLPGFNPYSASAPSIYGTNTSAPQSLGSNLGQAMGSATAMPTFGSGLGGAMGAATGPVASPMNQGTLNAMYAQMLGRAPDPSSNAWLGQSQNSVIQGIQSSPEYQQLHGMQTTPGVAFNGRPVAQPMAAPQAPYGQAGIDAAMRPLDYLSSMKNPYNTGAEDYGTYTAQMRNASSGLGQAIHSSFQNQAPPSNLAQLSQTAGYRAMTPAQQFAAQNPGSPQAPQQSTFQKAVSNIQPYGAQYQRNVAANPYYQTPQGQFALNNPQVSQMFQQQRMTQTPQMQNMYGNLYGSLSNLLSQHQGP